jgi:lysophospholipase L1-like esterase
VALTTEYATGDGTGDHTADAAPDAFTRTRTALDWIDEVDVRTEQASGTVVALGDSITDGSGLDVDADERWVDDLGRRFDDLPATDPRRRAVVNAGITFNFLCPTSADGSPGADIDRNPAGPAAVRRLGRDVISRAGVREAILFEGTNDLQHGDSASTVIDCMKRVAWRLHEHAIRVIGATVIPRDGGVGWDAAQDDPQRHKVNAWMRRTTAFDGVADFAQATASPDDPDQLEPGFELPDPADFGTHPNAAGHAAMADAVDLDAFAPATSSGAP